jgi:hypothetical protein
MDWYRKDARCQQIGGSRRHGVIVDDVWSGYIGVLWDSGRHEEVHIRDIRPEGDI